MDTSIKLINTTLMHLITLFWVMSNEPSKMLTSQSQMVGIR